MTFEPYVGPVAQVNVVSCSSVYSCWGWLDSFSLVASMLGFACQVVRGFWCICSLFRIRLCWGGGGAYSKCRFYDS